MWRQDVLLFARSRKHEFEFLSSKLDKVTLFTHSFVGWNLEHLYKQDVSLFFSLKLTSEKNPYFGKHLFGKQELITRARLGVQDLRTGKNFCFNQYHKKEFLSFFSVKLFYKRNRKLFSCVCITWYKHSRGWANCRQLCKPRDEVEGLHNCLEFSQPLECLYQAMQTRKTFSVA